MEDRLAWVFLPDVVDQAAGTRSRVGQLIGETVEDGKLIAPGDEVCDALVDFGHLPSKDLADEAKRFEQRGRPLGWLFAAMAGGTAFGPSLGVLAEPCSAGAACSSRCPH
ncbi:hypothetical protein [Iamia sp. SCSIO 61187]|uniref:hypothetical protein n=1 Tax=Iamia sp. SCSIO 61187 TaxID=2722752 RepID=UPI001C63AF60|nr:hypothetical protein [Iamia sp. SCSIO 61187]